METRKYDALIIGFGKGGKTLAGALAKAGRSVALAEADPGMYGGTCINVGCIPSKSLIASAAKAPSDNKETYFRQAIAEKKRLTSFLRQKNYDKLAKAGVAILDGQASFLAAHRVLVKGARETIVEAPQIFINTGAASRIPAIPGLDSVKGICDSRSLMELPELPKRLLVIGSGYIGLEFASMFAAFGTEVTVFEGSPDFLPREDADVAQELRAELEAQGIQFHFAAKVLRALEGRQGPELEVELAGPARRFAGDAVLVAAGRVPNTQGLGLEDAGIELSPKGAIKVDAQLRTTAEGVWALGDAAGSAQHTYVSLDDYRIVADQLLGAGRRSTADRANVPYSVFLHTPYARTGLNEKEAGAAGISFRVAKIPTAAVPKAQVLKETAGFLKALISPEGRILGAMLICPESYEMINIVKLAMDQGLPYTYLRDQIFTHPTMSEALNDLFA